MNTALRCASAIAFLASTCASLLAGGSGLNVVVVVNQNSPDSLALGNYYCEKRSVAPQNVLCINWNGSKIAWTKSDFESVLRAPLNAMLATRQLTDQIDYVLLSMDIPYRVVLTNASTLLNGANSTTSALHYGFKPDSCLACPSGLPSCNLPNGSASAYAGSEGIFRQTPPISSTSNSWLVMMLTSSNLAQAKAVVDRGVASDFTFPTQTVFLAKSTDRLRNFRRLIFDDALLNVRLRGGPAILRTNLESPNALAPAMGYQNGVQWTGLGTGLFAPGAMADNLTSFSGQIFEMPNLPNYHVTALAFLNAGATASYGTVLEPCAYYQKFPNAQNFFYEARGFSVAESYYMSVTNPYQGLLIGEPLAAPYASPSAGAWDNLLPDAVLSGTTNLTVEFDAANSDRPVQQADLFLDGSYVQTLTNIAPRQNNILYVTINGFTTNYTIPAGANLKSIASNLVLRLNATTYTNLTKVVAMVHGDRIGLQSLDITRLGANTTLQTSNSQGSATALTSFIQPARSNFLDKVSFGMRSYLITNSLVTVPAGDFLQCVLIKTNNSVVTIAVTNSVNGAAFNEFAKSFFDAINTHAAMQTADGIVVEDINMHEDWPYNQYVYGSNDHSGAFNVRARTPGWPESQGRVAITGWPGFTVWDAGTNRLDENVSDLQPRNHLYLTAGATNLAVTFALNTAAYPDGWHELTAAAYEGSHTRTQKRVPQIVRIQNSPLSAAFSCLVCDTNTALEATLQLSVVANTNNITRIELFGTGGSWGVVNNQPSATFSLAATNLGAGLHPFYALVTRNDGKQYRTETKWIRLSSDETPFPLAIASGAPTVSWPATAGRHYEILSTTNAAGVFLLRDAVTPTNSAGQWSETNNSAPHRLYRVRSAP